MFLPTQDKKDIVVEKRRPTKQYNLNNDDNLLKFLEGYDNASKNDEDMIVTLTGALKTENLSKFIGILDTMRKITNLSINGGISSYVFGELCDKMMENKSISVMCLENVRFGDNGTDFLCKVLGVNKKLEKLEISNNKITMKGIDLILETLKSNTTLKEIDFTLNDIRNENMEDLCVKIGDLKQLIFF
jgi:Ran GTPase-activating protein (RanGAP) involved in mRNA processing and transport